MDICSSRRDVEGEFHGERFFFSFFFFSQGDAVGIRLLSSLVRRSAPIRARFLALFARSPSHDCRVLMHLGARARVCFLIKEKKASNVALFDLPVVVVVSVKAVL